MTLTVTPTDLLFLLTIGVLLQVAVDAALNHLRDRYTFSWSAGRLPRLVRTWYGTGRTVHHPDLGRCRVLDVDLWACRSMSWLFIIRPDDDTEPGRWVPLSQVTETAEEMRAGEDR